MKLYITRHGQTDWNAKHIIQGRTDIPLNEEGRKQAQTTSEKLQDLPFDMIISSPLKRAYETASIINQAHQLDILCDERVMERGFGEYEGAALDKLDFTYFWRPEHEHLFPSCESTTQFYARVHDFINEVKETYADKNILVVAHAGVSLPFYTYFNGMPQPGDMRPYMLGNCEYACYEIVDK